MKIKRINQETTEIFYPPITSKPYIRDILIYDDETFSINTNWYSSNIHNDNNVIRRLLFKQSLIETIIKNKVIGEIITI